MPIEFVCEQCSRTLRVPDGSGGRQSQCPACHHVQQVPDAAAAHGLRSTAKSTAKSTGGIGPAVEAGDDKLSVPCPKCKHLLLCSPELLGTRGQCRQCKHIFTISLNPTEAAVAEPVALVFSCPQCQQLFEGREEMHGRKGKCHACHAVFTISLREAGKFDDTGTLGEVGTLSPGGALSPAGTAKGDESHTAPTGPATSRLTTTRAKKPQPTTSNSKGTKSAEPKSKKPEPAVPGAELPKSAPQKSSAEKSPSQKSTTRTSAAPTSPAPASTLAKFKLSRLPKTEQPVLAGANATEAAVLSPAGLQRRARRPAADLNGRAQTPIRFMCSQCHGLMEVPGTSAGMETACPYCQTVQTIPARSQVEEPAALEPLGFAADSLAEFAASPAALQHQWSAQSVARHRAGLTVTNVFQTAFENLFPSCLITLLHAAILGVYSAVALGMYFGMLMLLKAMGLPPESMIIAVFVGFGVLALVSVFVAAWFSAAIRHMALRAVRKMPLDIGQAFSPGGAYSVSVLIVFITFLFNLLIRFPTIFEKLSPGSFGMFGVVWVLALLPVIAIVHMLISFAWFAAIDGEGTGEAIGTSCRLLTKHLPVMIAVKVLVWLMTIPLAILTLGFAFILPIYFNATLYHLARKQQEL